MVEPVRGELAFSVLKARYDAGHPQTPICLVEWFIRPGQAPGEGRPVGEGRPLRPPQAGGAAGQVGDRGEHPGPRVELHHQAGGGRDLAPPRPPGGL